jgi:hypothetical protein
MTTPRSYVLKVQAGYPPCRTLSLQQSCWVMAGRAAGFASIFSSAQIFTLMAANLKVWHFIRR